MAVVRRSRAALFAACLVVAAAGLGACGQRDVGPVPAARAGSALAVGGMDELIRQAKAEGQLNTTTLLPHWANYGGLMDGFSKKYGIKVVNDNPEGSSQQEIDDMKRYRGQSRAPDVLDLGDSFAQSAADQGLLAPYRTASYDRIPGFQKDHKARWYNSYGGFVAIGCDAKRVKNCPESFAELLDPQYKGMVALTGEPTSAGSAFAAVYAVALANGGSFGDIRPGIDFFAELNRIGNFNHANSSVGAIAAGQTPISVEWDFLNLQHVDGLRAAGVDWKVSIPFDGSFAQYYAQAINKDAPHPAAARLWEEYLISDEGQNLRLVDYARPVLMDVMAHEGTLDRALADRLPTVEGTTSFPTQQELVTALAVVKADWPAAVPK
ncbi:extracellular solute-binding protein [Kitasatospora sp. YST-16]|uniref:ABC transporter substrate-binding protein n=1 Tax=Kitasatospora sp. YST-16 TaxID=2998080 RepID=UPI0022842DD5|nr:extracellular solute-binding protein [Kitasatospora sp. YST-16]WAL74815.1 extracellular solute-binding protein [Kitasatospora sp. YST-16]WNW40869.1 extracellular solute-binding protein [Streptomyces sp. Li-HN-5-13]